MPILQQLLDLGGLFNFADPSIFIRREASQAAETLGRTP